MIKFEIKIFENTAFGHVTEVPIAHLIVFVSIWIKVAREECSNIWEMFNFTYI